MSVAAAEDLVIRAARPTGPVHPEVTVASIEAMVATFYERVRADERLGPLFEHRLAGRWPQHLERMVSFWRTVLLREVSFKGDPVGRHRAHADVVSGDYALWLDLFRQVVRTQFAPDAAQAVIAAAERIAESLWLASFAGPGTRPPAFLRSAA